MYRILKRIRIRQDVLDVQNTLKENKKNLLYPVNSVRKKELNYDHHKKT